MSAASDAAALASLLPAEHPIAQLSRMRLDVAVRQERNAMSTPVQDGPTLIGSPLRDAAVDPHPSDFPGVVNAGEPGALGNPHGPNVRCVEVDSLEWARRVAEQRASQEQGA